MGEKINHTKEKIKNAKNILIENSKKNIALLLIGVYLIIITLWNITTLYLIGDIDLRLFLILIIDGFNTPIVIITSLVLTGKYKNAEFDKEAMIKEHALDKQLSLAKQEIANLQEIQELNHVIGDLHQKNKRMKKQFTEKMENQRELNEYKCQLAARDGKVPDAILSNKGWNEANQIIENIENLEDKKNDGTE